jgi:hypothetical protein
MSRKKKRDSYRSFAAVEKRIWLRCEEWRNFSPGARDLYALLKCGYSPGRNGEIQLFYSEVRGVKGLSSPRTISKLFRELEAAGWIECTWHGGLYRRPNKYRLTGKIDRML